MNKQELERLVRIADDQPPCDLEIHGKYGWMIGGMKVIKSELQHIYQCQFSREWKFNSTADSVANTVAEELSLAKSRMYWAERRGDNGDGDYGYEIRTFGVKGSVCYIGVTLVDGYWVVVFDTADGDVPLNCIDDLLLHMEKNR